MKPLALLLSLLVVSGCATLLRGSRQDVRFETTPPGALVTMEGRQPPSASESSHYVRTCTTPCALDLHRSGYPASYRVQLDGHQAYSGELAPNDDLGGLIALPVVFDLALILPYVLIDRTSGALYAWPEAVRVTLPPVGSGISPEAVVTRR